MEKSIKNLESVSMPSSFTENSTLTVYHLSRKPNLTKLDPKFQGTGLAGKEKLSSEYKKPPFINFYLDSINSHIEDALFDKCYVYTTTIPSNSIYDSRKKLISGKDVVKLKYKGIYLNPDNGQEQIRYYYPITVKTLGVFHAPTKNVVVNGKNIKNYIKES